MAIRDVNYAVEILTGTNETDADIGLSSGVFRFITGRPGYSGVGYTFGANEWESATDYHWYEGWITKNGMSNPSRLVDISKGGNYGNFGTFTFKLRNNDLFWNQLDAGVNGSLSSSINLINREVRVYSVIDDVFYQIWGGSITNLPRTDKEYQVYCEDSSSSLHKDLPGGLIDDIAVPVVLGDNSYVKGVNVGSGRYTPLYNRDVDGNGGYISPVWDIADSNVATAPSGNGLRYKFGISIVHDGDIDFDTDELANKYLELYQGGTSSLGISDEKLVRINGNTKSFFLDFPNAVRGVTLWTDGYFDTEPESYIRWVPDEYTYQNSSGEAAEHINAFVAISGYKYGQTYVRILDPGIKFAVNASGTGYSTNQAYKYNESNGDFEVLSSEVVDNGDGTVTVYAPNISSDGNIQYFSRLNTTFDLDNCDFVTPATDASGYPTHPSGWNVISLLDHKDRLFDRDETTYVEEFIPDPSGAVDTLKILPSSFYMRFDFTIDDDISDIDDVYFGMDFTLYAVNDNGVGRYLDEWVSDYVIYPHSIDDTPVDFYDFTQQIGYGYTFYDLNASRWLYSDEINYPESSKRLMPHFALPKDYYTTNIEINKNESGILPGIEPFVKRYMRENGSEMLPYFDAGDAISSNYYKNVIRMPDAPKDNWDVSNKYSVFVHIYRKDGATLTPYDLTLRIHQVGLFYANKTSLENDIYLKASGLTTSGTNTNSVYGTFKYILEDHDGISPSNIDYGNLELQRDLTAGWRVGRQITKQKNSSHYLRELCSHSFTSMHPDRLGRRAFNCWLDNQESPYVDNDNNIVRDSIDKFNYFKIRDIYNRYQVKYDENVASNEYDRQLYVINTDRSSFPDENSDWRSYVYGINSYEKASGLWEGARAGYLISNTQQSPPDNLQELPWYRYYAADNDNNSPALYLERFIRWCSRSHIATSYKIPVTSGNIQRELTEKVTLTDYLYTNNLPYSGYIDSITYDVRNDQIKIGAILEPNDGFDPYEEWLIVEAGDQPSTIQESGNWATTYEEE